MPGFKLPEIAVLKTIPGREVLIDADCVAYYGAAGCDEMTPRSATRRADLRMKQIIDETRAESYTGYLTGQNNFRDIVATLQRYKGNRYDKNGKRITPQPAWLKHVRLHLQNEWGCKMIEGQEADDALSIHQNQAEHDTIISSIDKDLMINLGLHHDMNSGELTEVTGYGDIWMKKSACKGNGLKFFLAQLLMGDSADWIKGLPSVTPMMKADFGVARLGGCGPKAAYNVINDTQTYKEGLERVILCYEDFWMQNGYTHWNQPNKEYKPGPTTAYKQLVEQGQLLWMRRCPGEMWSPELCL